MPPKRWTVAAKQDRWNRGRDVDRNPSASPSGTLYLSVWNERALQPRVGGRLCSQMGRRRGGMV